jgi:serine/threonine protein kinase
MGCVYEATHRALGKRVAIKRFHPQLALSEDSLARFIGEGRAIAQVRHAHIVEVFDLGGEEDGSPYLVMELLEGCTLAEYLERGAVLALPEAVDLALPLVSALSAAHRAGVVHRDIKPSNVFLRRERLSEPCIVDFGVSKHASRAPVDVATQAGTLLGSYPYFSPEHTRGAKNVTSQSDMYSLGVVLYECVTGARPFQGNSAYELMHAIATQEVRPPSHVLASIPREFDDVLLRAMDRDPLHRYPTMHAFGAALLGFATKRSWHIWSTEFAALNPAHVSLERTAHDKLPTAWAMRRREGPRALKVALGLGVTLLCVSGALVHAASVSGTPVALPAPSSPIPPPIAATPPVASASVIEPADPPALSLSATPPPAPPSRPAPTTRRDERGSNGVAIFD